MDKDLITALTNLEEELDLNTPLNANLGNNRLRFSNIVLEIKNRICPRKELIKERMRSEGANMTIVLTDALLSFVTALPLVAASLAKYIFTIGIDTFCSDPMALLNTNIEVKNEDG